MAAQKNAYSASSITVLEGLEAVRKRPGMYIGSTGERGLHHLIWEVVDNAVDEAMAGYATRVEVTLQDDGGVRVVDDGRGIPVGMHPVEKKPAVEIVMTVLHAGGKFDNDSYAVSGGLHGVGVSVVNALSAAVDVEIHTDGHVWRQHYARSVPGPLRKGEATKKTGSSVTFWPTANLRDATSTSRRSSRRLQEMAFLNKGLTIVLRDERNGATAEAEEPDAAGYVSKIKEYVFRYPGGLEDFVAHINKRRTRSTRSSCRSEARKGPRGRGRDAVELRLHRVGLHLREHDQHPRGRHPRGGLPVRADLDGQPLRARQEAAQGQGPGAVRRRHP